jgi:hypothetical protein
MSISQQNRNRTSISQQNENRMSISQQNRNRMNISQLKVKIENMWPDSVENHNREQEVKNEGERV